MTEALQAVFTLLLIEVGFKEVQAKYVSLNPASGSVMEKAGMQYLATLPNAVARKRLCRRSNNLHYPFF